MINPLFSLDRRTSRNTRIGAIAVQLFLLLGNMPLAHAANWEIDPVRVHLSPALKTAAITLRNGSDQPSTLQLDAVTWHQQDGKDIYESTREVLISPPIVTIAPYGSQVIRVALRRAPDANDELTYRINLQELPVTRNSEFSGIQVALRVSVPVFVDPARGKASAHLVWTASTLPDQRVNISATNSGNAHLQISDFELQDPAAAKRLAGDKVAVYLLPGQTHEWQLDGSGLVALRGDHMRLKAFTDAGVQKSDVVLVRQ